MDLLKEESKIQETPQKEACSLLNESHELNKAFILTSSNKDSKQSKIGVQGENLLDTLRKELE